LSLTTISPLSTGPELNDDDEAAVEVDVGLCDERPYALLAPAMTEVEEDEADGGRRLRWWWKRLRRTLVVPIVLELEWPPWGCAPALVEAGTVVDAVDAAEVLFAEGGRTW